jgi:hypothetical protein
MMTSLETPLGRAPIVNAAEHARVVGDPQFPLDPDAATCPENMPVIDKSAEYLIEHMDMYSIDQTVIGCPLGAD